MAKALRKVRREDVSRGDEIYLIIKPTDNPEDLKFRRARVDKPMRAGARLKDIEGESKPRVVRYNELALKSDVETAANGNGASNGEAEGRVVRRSKRKPKPLKAVPPAFHDVAEEQEMKDWEQKVHYKRQPEAAPEVHAESAEPEPEMAEQEAPAASDDTVEDLDTEDEVLPQKSAERELEDWVEKGDAIRRQLVSQANDIETEVSTLMEEHTKLEQRIGEQTSKLTKLRKRIELLDQISHGLDDET